jgi:peptidoglycan/xylan/chitin deacetylase (PgdA/CDA1 family)
MKRLLFIFRDEFPEKFMQKFPITLKSPCIRLQELRNPKRQVLILCYHRVLPQLKWGDPFLLQTTLNNFEQHIQYLASTYTIISLQKFIHHVQSGCFPERRQVLITFDDGYRDNYLYAYPILKQWHVPATVFLSPQYIEAQALFFWERVQYLLQRISSNHLVWKVPECDMSFEFLETQAQRRAALLHIHKKLRMLPPRKIFEVLGYMEKHAGFNHPVEVEPEDLPLTWEYIREMAETMISFGAHTHTHPVLSTLPHSEAEQEILRSKQVLENHLQQEINLFAYPYGETTDFTEATKSILKRHNFLCACSTIPGTNDLTCDLFDIKRVVVRNWDALTLARKIAHAFKFQEWIV